MPDKSQPNDSRQMDSTQPLRTIDVSRPLPPAPDRSHVHAPQETAAPRRREERKARARRDRSSSGLYLPAWSVGLMLLIVLGIAASIVMLLYTLGGGNAPAGEPRVVIITAVPTEPPDPAQITEPAPTDPPAESGGIPLPTFALEGPTLPPIIFTPTPVAISIGATVIVDAEGLNVRAAAGLDGNVRFQPDEGDRFVIVDGPQQASGITWWQISDPDDTSRSGWAAADYLLVARE